MNANRRPIGMPCMMVEKGKADHGRGGGAAEHHHEGVLRDVGAEMPAIEHDQADDDADAGQEPQCGSEIHVLWPGAFIRVGRIGIAADRRVALGRVLNEA